MVLKNCTFYNEFFEKEFGDIRIENGTIAEIGIINEDGNDMSKRLVLPGFVDIHIHGANGGDTNDISPASMQKISDYLARHGVTSFCPTTMTAPIDTLCSIAQNIKSSSVSGAKIAGINFEGPFISKEKCGSQNREYITAGSIEAFDRIYSASGGLMKLITVAPEAFDSDEFIKYASEKCTVAIGHSDADCSSCKRAMSLGTKHITHLYNAMSQMTARSAGIVGSALDSDVTCEIICDGFHVCPAVLRNTFKILGEDRAVVISDSMSAAGKGNGEYLLGSQKVYVKENDGVARLFDGTIAASTSNLFEEFKNLISFGVDFRAALKACTINPAKVIKEDGRIGSIAVGKCADFVITDEELNITEVYINGTYS